VKLLSCGISYYQLNHGYHQLFLLSAIGNFIALVLTFYNWKILKDRHTSFIESTKKIQIQGRWIATVIIIALFLALRVLLEHTTWSNQIILIVGAAMLFIITSLAVRQPRAAERKKMYGYIILALASLIFWALYQLAPMGLNLFIERNVNRHILGFVIAPQWVQNINSFVIITGGPLLSVAFSHLRERGININIPLQFSLALMLIGAGFAILPFGISLADAQGYVNFNWVLVSYILQSVGELFISPIGYAMIGQLAPLHLRGLLMGSWLMLTGIAAILSDHFSKVALGGSQSINPLVSNPSYSHTFGMLGWSAIAVGLCLFAAMPFVTWLTQERE
jgi:proton-dependent oligopeptide transporter, POT family